MGFKTPRVLVASSFLRRGEDQSPIQLGVAGLCWVNSVELSAIARVKTSCISLGLYLHSGDTPH